MKKSIVFSVTVLCLVVIGLLNGCIPKSTIKSTLGYGEVSYYDGNRIVIGDKIVLLQGAPLHMIAGGSYIENPTVIDMNQCYYLYSTAPYNGSARPFPPSYFELRECEELK